MYTLAEQFVRICNSYPDKTAVVENAVRMESRKDTSYAELLRQAAVVAGHITSTGITPGSRVALVLPNSATYIAACYGVLMAGCVVVPLNADSRFKDISTWIRHCDASLFFISASHPDYEKLCGCFADMPRITCDGDAGSSPESIAWNSLLERGQAVDPGEMDPVMKAPACILYTSGTTGHPKGVTLSNENLAVNIQQILSYLPVDSTDKPLCVLPFYFSFGNSVLHTHLLTGATLFLENSFMFPVKLLQLIQDEGLTSFSGVPTNYEILLKRTDMTSFELGSIRYFAQAGGAMNPASIKKVRELVPSAKFYVMYGQTEATSRISWLPPEELDSKQGSVGLPLEGVRIRVESPDDKGVGEVCIKGKNVMQGYWNDDEETASVLRDGWLHTGDLGYLDDDGYLYIAGRSSEMIKSGANRISPYEIEEVVQAIEGVEMAAVSSYPDEILGEAILLVVMPREGSGLTEKDILRRCREELPVYKMPKKVVLAEELPRTSTGKIQRRRLAGLIETG